MEHYRKVRVVFRVMNFLLLFSFAFVYQQRPAFSNTPLSFSNEFLTKIKTQFGAEAFRRAKKWQRVLDENVASETLDMLFEINNFFNEIPYYTDKAHWGKADYWATPMEMLGTNGGDCEDYVIAKYYSLRSLGVPDEKLRMMFVTALHQNQAHMVLAYYPEPNAIPLILDNINPRILRASQRRDLRPVYSFNGEGLWMAKAQGRGTQLGKSRHKMWDDLTTRIERDF